MDDKVTQQYTMEIGDYLAILRRRSVRFYFAFFLIFISGVVIALVLPPVYYSEATILIERQEIPQDLVATTVTGYVQERIEGIKQLLTTHETLLEIARKFDLYPEMSASGDLNDIVKEIRKSISVQMVAIKGTDPGLGRSGEVTVAFTVGYESDAAETAKNVAAELASRYLEVNKESREEQTAVVSKFLEEEAEKMRLEIETLEKSLATFKQERAKQLPELMNMNLSLYEKTEGQIVASKDRILKLEDTINSLSAELSLTDPRKEVLTDEGRIIQSPSERLSALIAEYLQASARYTPSHPDIVKLRREIKTLGSQTEKAAEVNKILSSLTVLRSQLLEVVQKYTSEHPDVKKLEASVANVEKALREIVVVESPETSYAKIPPNNPRYVALQTQLKAAHSNLKEERSKLRNHIVKLEEYEQRLFLTPTVERDYKSLARDYANATAKYNDLKAKRLQAGLAQQLEAGSQGERFVLAGPAYLPTSPDKPNRLGIILLAGFLAFSGGIGSVAKAEYMDRSVRGKRGVFEVFGALPIVIVPYIENSLDRSRKRSRRIQIATAIMVILVIILAAIHNLYMPLDELWLQLLDFIGLSGEVVE